MRRMVLGSLFAFTLTTVTAVAANLRVDGKLISTASTGAPIEVASETLVEHLNADLVDGLHAEDLVTQDYLTETAAIHRELSFAVDSTFVVPAGVNRIEVTVIGGGGGGAGGAEETGGGGGGGAGAGDRHLGRGDTPPDARRRGRRRRHRWRGLDAGDRFAWTSRHEQHAELA